jgi:hypothetical protein
MEDEKSKSPLLFFKSPNAVAENAAKKNQIKSILSALVCDFSLKRRLEK